MSWLFSQALVAEYSAGTCSDGEPCALLSGSPTPQAFLSPDRMTAFSRPSRFGMTFGHLTDTLGAELLTWFRGVSLARTSAAPAKVPDLTESAAAYGARWRELSVKYDRGTSSWRTHRSLWDEDLSACSLTLPTWGLMRRGVLWELPTLAPRINATGFGLLPTPQRIDSCFYSTNLHKASREGKQDLITCRLVREHGQRYPTPTFAEWMMGWPERWTDIGGPPVETGKFRAWLLKHSPGLPVR